MIALATVLPLAYLAVGSAIVRRARLRRYAAPPREFRYLVKEWHSMGCYWRTQGTRCDCRLRPGWIVDHAWRKHLDNPEKNPRPLPPPPFTPSAILLAVLGVLGWPVALYGLWVLGSAPVETRRERRHRMELENAQHIAEVTATVAKTQETLGDLLAPRRSTLDL